MATMIKLYTQKLLGPGGAYDRGAIMAKAHREMKARRRRGEASSFGACLEYAWRVARDQRAARTSEMRRAA